MFKLVLCVCFIVVGGILCVFFFFKQKTAYEMRISDWSSDVCSSDLTRKSLQPQWQVIGGRRGIACSRSAGRPSEAQDGAIGCEEIGRASCRERVCQYV